MTKRKENFGTYKHGLRQVQAFKGDTNKISELLSWAGGVISIRMDRDGLVISNKAEDGSQANIELSMEVVDTVYFVKLPGYHVAFVPIDSFEKEWSRV